jgi:hypothetical protein
MSEQHPLISCVCVTREKPVMLERAIRGFLAQTYPCKEMIILFEGDDDSTRLFIETMPSYPDVKVFSVDRQPEVKLGKLRNLAMQKANGEYICQWDDDDWFHIGRLEYQYAIVAGSGFAGSIMTEWLVFDTITAKAYISNSRLWEGSIFCKKEVLAERGYENKSSGEDSVLIQSLFSAGKLCPITDLHHLYIYIYHGQNTFNAAHWRLIFQLSSLLPDHINIEIQKILTEEYNAVEGSLLLDKLFNNPIVEADLSDPLKS